jgi:hypothetical protein
MIEQFADAADGTDSNGAFRYAEIASADVTDAWSNVNCSQKVAAAQSSAAEHGSDRPANHQSAEPVARSPRARQTRPTAA